MRQTICCLFLAVTQWVVVTHIVNPSQFYVQSVAERRESEILSDKINQLCSGDGCSFTVKDTVETGLCMCVCTSVCVKILHFSLNIFRI